MARNNSGTDIFISYKRGPMADKFVDQLSEKIEAGGWSTFVDRQNIVASDELWDRIASNIESCWGIIPVITTEYCNSKWCKKELVHAESKDKKIFPVMLGPGRPNYEQAEYGSTIDVIINNLLYVRFSSGEYEEPQMQELLRGIREKCPQGRREGMGLSDDQKTNKEGQVPTSGVSTEELGERAKEILRKYTYKLPKQLRNILTPIKGKLVQEGIIDGDAVDLRVLGVSDQDKAASLYDAVVDSIELNPGNYPKLVRILRSFTTLTTVADELTKAGKDAGLIQ